MLHLVSSDQHGNFAIMLGPSLDTALLQGHGVGGRTSRGTLQG